MSLAPQVDFKNIDMRCPRYRYAKIPLNNLSSSSVTVSPTALTLLEWRIPASSVVNLSRSFVQYNLTVPAVADSYAMVFEQGSDFRNVFYGGSSGLGIVDLQQADQYVNGIRPIRTAMKDFINGEQLSQFYPCNQPANTNLHPWSSDGLSLGTENAGSVSFLEPQHLRFSALNTALTVPRLIPLSQYKDTFLGLDKDSVFGQDMFLRLWFNFLSRCYQYTTTPATPNLNVAVPGVTTTISNVYLYLAIEENLDLRSSLLSALASGSIKMSIPYQYCYRFSSAQGTSASFSFVSTKQYGRALKSMLLLPCNGQELTNYAFDHSNVNGTKMATVQFTLDGRPLTDSALNCYNYNSTVNPAGVAWASPSQSAEDWRENQVYIKNSCIFNYPQYQNQWFYKLSFGELPNDTADWGNCDQSRINEGIDLIASGDHTIAMTANTSATAQGTNNCNAAGLILYLYCYFLRTLQIQPDGYVMMS